MSVNIYLNNNVREFSGFKSEPNKDSSGQNLTVNGMHVFGEKGGLYLMWSEATPVPDELKEFVDKVTCHESIPQIAHRESGIYRYESAELELMPADDGSTKREKLVYRLKVTAKTLEDVQAILHKVKTGAIRPEESYEEKQGGKTRQQLETELAQTQQKLSEVQVTVEVLLRATKKSFEKDVRIRHLARTIENASLPLVFGSTVARQIESILDSNK